jgi:hypothetical protein
VSLPSIAGACSIDQVEAAQLVIMMRGPLAAAGPGLDGMWGMRYWLIAMVVAMLTVLIAPSALSVAQTASEAASEDSSATDDVEPSELPSDDQSEPAELAQIRLEVFCYSDSLDVSQSQAADDCADLGEFGRDWEQLLEVFDGEGAVTDTAFPQTLSTATPVDYLPDGAWRGSDPVLPEGWRVIECPFLGDQDDDVTNGVGQVLEAEPLPYVDRRHVVCYQFTGDEAPTNGEIPKPSRVDTGGGGTAT